MKDFLKEYWAQVLVLVLTFAAVVALIRIGIYSCREADRAFEAAKAYDNEHCIRYEAVGIHHRKCVCYDNEKCANFVQEIQ